MSIINRSDERDNEEYKNYLLNILNERFIFLKNGDLIMRENLSEEIKARVSNVDMSKEIFDLWIQATFLQYVLNEIIINNAKIAQDINDEIIERCYRKAQIFIIEKFKLNCENEK